MRVAVVAIVSACATALIPAPLNVRAAAAPARTAPRSSPADDWSWGDEDDDDEGEMFTATPESIAKLKQEMDDAQKAGDTDRVITLMGRGRRAMGPPSARVEAEVLPRRASRRTASLGVNSDARSQVDDSRSFGLSVS